MKTIQSIALLLTFSINFFAYSFDGDLELGIFQLNRGEFKAAIAEFEPLIAEEYSPAQYQMALIYENGWGVKKDPQKAFEFMSLAAAQNYPDALFNLSVMYSEGEIVKKDLKTAFVLMEKAANKELPSAQFNLGVMYANAIGVDRDLAKAAKWYEMAARQNYTLAQFNLALMYFEGKGVKKSTEMSYVWNYIAARSGYTPAIKSRDMDEHKLSVDDIQKGRDHANSLYAQIIEQIDLKNKKRAQQRY
ncbi:tetratricopeptide repeat protein [Colwellia sp. 1_MG-2023]|uniref:tetratricopeptide repeat protein n=1 Tax=Colwellia sp. 1_MG-2023 TaxID=3062649 RepID=UPI0026E46BF3|nr:tetratricopeptide repeat protein [Colwellia sp. 1_MG-2023]MDO6447452.1 tetratricopeptide repeat protein [Colwellia sp. 1_MG-2023]